MSENFYNVEITKRRAAIIQDRIDLVKDRMYKQFVEYQQANANTAAIFDKMVENIKPIAEYFKKSFNMRGIPTQSINFEYDKQRYIAVLNILWLSITFAADLKGTPKALERAKDLPTMISGRIIAIKGVIPELVNGYTPEVQQKLLDMEVASLYIPADTSAKAIMKIKTMAGESPMTQIEAPIEFPTQIIEMVCSGGNLHKESSRVTISI